MFNTEILSFLSLLGDCADACGRLEKYGYGGKALEEAAADYVQKAIKHNVELVRSSSCKNDDATFLIGRYELQKYGSSENLEKFVGNLYGRKHRLGRNQTSEGGGRLLPLPPDRKSGGLR